MTDDIHCTRLLSDGSAPTQHPHFTYGDIIRRKSDGRLFTVERIGTDGYHFRDGGYALIDDQDCYTLVEKASGYFRVAETIDCAPLADHTAHGYEDRSDFRDTLRAIVSRWGGRIGEKRQERNGFLQLHFADMPGKVTEDVWLPLYLLTPCPIPDYLIPPPTPDPIEKELDQVFGFD